PALTTHASLHSFAFHRHGAHRDLHSFPTRRSSDLVLGRGRRPGPPRVVSFPRFGMRGDGREFGEPSNSGERLTFQRDGGTAPSRSEEHTSELQSRFDLVCRLLLEKKKTEETQNPIQ